MAETRETLVQHYREMRARFLLAIDGLDDARLTEPSIDGWSVKDHMLHIAFWDGLRSGDIRRISAGHETAWKLDGRDGQLNAIAFDMRKDMTLGQARWELAVTHEAVLDAIEGMAERALDPSLYGEMGLRGQHEAVHTTWIARWCSQRV